MKFQVKVSDYKFACLIEHLLAEYGITASGGGIALDTGWRDLEFEGVEIPDDAPYIPKPIEVNLPDLTYENPS